MFRLDSKWGVGAQPGLKGEGIGLPRPLWPLIMKPGHPFPSGSEFFIQGSEFLWVHQLQNKKLDKAEKQINCVSRQDLVS